MAYRGGARPDTIIEIDTETPEESTKVIPQSQKRGTLESTLTPKKRTILESIPEETHLPHDLKQRNESPWISYDKQFELELSSLVTVTVAVQREPRSALVNIRKFTRPEMEAALYRYQTVRHGSFVATLEAFITDDHLYVVLEHTPISLEHVVQVSRYPTEVQLVAILTPVKVPCSLSPE